MIPIYLLKPMFTGIIETTGRVVGLKPTANLAVLSVDTPKLSRGTKLGDSIAINGVCLTVCRKSKSVLSFDMMKETLDKTTLGASPKGSRVNMERAMQMQSRVGGHYVTGHVDDMAVLTKIVEDENYTELRFQVPAGLRPYIVPKGSISLDGVSLTVGRVFKKEFAVYLIPFTLKVTTLGCKKVGDRVNVEVDILARYVYEQTQFFRSSK